MPIIEYIGNKERKEDNVAGTGLVWEGNGDRHEVSNKKQAALLLAHEFVWAEVPKSDEDSGGPGLSSAELDALKDKPYEEMEDSNLKGLAKSRGINVGNARRETIIKLLKQHDEVSKS